MDQARESFLERALEVYMRYGIKSVTMDDMARHLGVSKKTIYKYVDDKKDLVCKVMESQMCQERQAVLDIQKSADNAIDANLKISQMVIAKLRQIQPGVFYDLEKYHPKAMKLFDEHKSKFIYDVVLDNLKAGIDQGLYRSDMNVQVVAMIHVHTIHSFFRQVNDHLDHGLSLVELHEQLFSYQMHAIVSEKGHKYLHERMNND